MFLDSAVTRSTLTAGPSSISYLVTVGPRLKSTTCASTWNCSNTSVSAAITTSLALVRCFGAVPGRSSAVGGSVYATASPPISVSCSGLRSGAVGFGTAMGDSGAGASCGAGSSCTPKPSASTRPSLPSGRGLPTRLASRSSSGVS
jgi:hypothetical protein